MVYKGGEFFLTQDQIENIKRGLGEYANQSRFIARRGKEPVSPITGYGAKADDPSTWGTFDRALALIGKNGVDGIGVELGSGLCGIDIDHCIDEKGEVSKQAQDIVSTMAGGYVEISPSGHGMHVLFIGSIPEGARHRENVEMYEKGRYFTLTGNGEGIVGDRTEQAAVVHKKYLAKPEPAAQVPTAPIVPASLSDSDLIEKIRRSRNGTLFDVLWRGDVSDYKSHSEADIAFCNLLAFWTGCDTAQMDRLFRSSGLFREKWDRPQSGSTYGALTIHKAIDDCRQVYEPGYRADTYRVFVSAMPTPSKGIDPLSNLQRYTLDDTGAARHFADMYRGQVCYVPQYKKFMVYNGKAWALDEGELLVRQLSKEWADFVCAFIPPPTRPQPGEQLKDKWEPYRKHYAKYRFFKNRRTLIQDVQDEVGAYANDFDRQPFLFNMKNGTFNLETMKLQPHSPADKLSKMANVAYDPETQCERFEQFIVEITEGNADRARMLQKALGYALKGEANEECYFTAIGEKTRNGKGTLFDTVLNIFGSYGAQMDFNTISRCGAKDGSRATPDVARLIGMRFALANEPEKGVCINEALLKQLTGGDEITGRPLYGDILQFKPVFTLFVTANSKPSVSDDSLFSSGRIKLLPFTRHFNEDEQDANLKRGFRTEEAKSGILAWLLEGYRMYQAEGLKDTSEMKALTEEYRRENDYIGQYLDERVNFGAAGTTTVKALRLDYSNWCGVVGTKPLGLKMFKEELQKHGIEVRVVHRKQAGISGQIRSGYDYEGIHAV